MTIDVDDQVVTLPDDTLLTCDIVLRDYGVIVEYDGSHWHKHRGAQDENKTARLVAAGWTVIRLREHPLPRIGHHDVAVATNCGLRKLTIATLEAITSATGQKAFNLSSYRKPGPSWGQKDADEWIAAHLADRDDERRCNIWNSAGARCTRDRDRRNGMCATHASRTDRRGHPQADIPIRTPATAGGHSDMRARLGMASGVKLPLSRTFPIRSGCSWVRGRRPGKALGACWSDFDAGKRILTMSGNVMRARGRGNIRKDNESENAARPIPMPECCAHMFIERSRLAKNQCSSRCRHPATRGTLFA